MNMVMAHATLLYLGLRQIRITYNPAEAKKHCELIPTQTRDFRYNKLPIDAIKIIKSLRLNCKRRRHRYTAQKRLNRKHEHGS